MKNIFRILLAAILLASTIVLTVSAASIWNDKTGGDVVRAKQIIVDYVTTQMSQLKSNHPEPTATEIPPTAISTQAFPAASFTPALSSTPTTISTVEFTMTAMPTVTATLTSTPSPSATPAIATEMPSAVPEITGTTDGRPYGIQTRSAVQTQAAK